MKNFKDFNIKVERKGFTGDKIKIEKILNVEITVHNFDIKPSTAKPGTNFLTLQIERNGQFNIVWTGSVYLMDAIRKVPEDGFPFLTTIIKQDECLEFT